MERSTNGDKSLQRQSTDSGKSPSQFASFRTTASSSSRPPTLSTSLLFARQRSSDSSVLSSLQASLQGDGHSVAEATAAETTIYPDTINPEFQPTRSTGARAHVKSPLATPVVERAPLHVESPLFADLSSDYALHMNAEESTAMPPNQTLDQMLAQDSKGTQQLLPLQQRQDAVLKVNDVADRASAAPAVHQPPPAPKTQQPVHASTRRQSEDSVDEGSEDWDVVGSDQEDAATAHASHVNFSPIPGSAAARMSASGRVGSSSTRHLSSAGEGISQYDEFASMDRVPRFDTMEPQYTYGDGGGPPPADCKFYIAVMMNGDDVIEVDSPKRRDAPNAQSTPETLPYTNAEDYDEEEEDDSDSETVSDTSDESETPSPTPRVLLPSPMQDRATRAATIASATISTLASMPAGAGTATLETSGDVTASCSKALTSNASSAGTSSQIPSPPQRDSNTQLPPTQSAQLNTPPRLAASEPGEQHRKASTLDYAMSHAATAHAPTRSPLRPTTSAGWPPPRAGNGGAGGSTAGTPPRSYMHASAASPHVDRAAGNHFGRSGGASHPRRASYQMPMRERQTADPPLGRSLNSALLPGADRSFTERGRRSSFDQAREHDRLRNQGNASAHSTSLASVQTPDSGMSMQGSDAYPFQVMEPSLQEWPTSNGNGGGHRSSQQYARSRYSSDHTASKGLNVPQQRASDGSGASRHDESFVSSTAGLTDLRAGSGFPNSPNPHNADGRHSAYPGKKVERWQELPRQAQLVQKQIKREMQLLGSLRGDPLGQFQFHIPLFAAMWGTIREAAVVPCLFTRAYKEVLGAAVSRGNLCRFCTYWHANTANELGVVGMRETWRKRTMSHLPGCPKRFKAVLLWFRDATHLQFFTEPNAVPAPFTVEESAELIAVSFMNNMLNRVTIAQLTENETLPMMGVFRPLIQIFPSFQAVIYKSLYKPVSKEAALPGLSAEVRPQTRHSPGSSFKWAAPLPHIADALSYLEGVVNYHLRGRFLPLDLCDKFMMWMDQQYNGIYRGKDHFDNWLIYAAQDAYPDDPQRQDAMLYMLLVACSPVKAGIKMSKVLRARGWRHSQIQAMAPFAAFHAARITALWQATVPCVSEAEAANDALWTVKVPDGELW